MFDQVLWWTALTLTAILALLTAAPLVRSGKWFIRAWDFPRLQLAGLAVVPVFPLLLLLARGSHQTEAIVTLCVLAVLALWGLAQLMPFTRLWHKEVGELEAPTGNPSPNGSAFTIFVANIRYESTEYESVAHVLMETDADLLLLIEVNQPWFDALAAVRDRYPHRIESIAGEGLGLALWSKRPFHDGHIEHIISKRRPSIFADFDLDDGRRIRFVGLHPTPPGLRDSTGEDRRDSRVRDGELVLLARHIAEDPRQNWVVAGDFNDVAWSHTTRLFKRLSGLLDPRVGRAMLNTYHAQYPLLRYPVDHLFVAPGFRLGGLERVRLPGSDHFGVLGCLQLQPTPEAKPAEPEADTQDHQEAAQAVAEGVEDAKERSVAVQNPGVRPA